MIDGAPWLFLQGDWRVAPLDKLLRSFAWVKDGQGCTEISVVELEAADSATLAVLMEWVQQARSKIAQSIGTTIIPAQRRGATTQANGLTAIISMAFSCSVAFMELISAVSADPARPAKSSAVNTGPSSRRSDRATRVPSAEVAPKRTSA